MNNKKSKNKKLQFNEMVSQRLTEIHCHIWDEITAKDMEDEQIRNNRRGYIGTGLGKYANTPIYVSRSVAYSGYSYSDYIATMLMKYMNGDMGAADWERIQKDPDYCDYITEKAEKMGVYIFPVSFWGWDGTPFALQIVEEYDFYEKKDRLRVYSWCGNPTSVLGIDEAQLDSYEFLFPETEADHIKHFTAAVQNALSAKRICDTDEITEAYGRYSGTKVVLSDSVIRLLETESNIQYLAKEIGYALNKFIKLDEGFKSEKTHQVGCKWSFYKRTTGENDYGFVVWYRFDYYLCKYVLDIHQWINNELFGHPDVVYDDWFSLCADEISRH